MSTQLPLAKRIIINGQPLSANHNIHRVCYGLQVIPTSYSVYLAGERGKVIDTVRYYCDFPIEYTNVDMIKIGDAVATFEAKKVSPSSQSTSMCLNMVDRVIDISTSETNGNIEVTMAIRNVNRVYPEKRK